MGNFTAVNSEDRITEKATEIKAVSGYQIISSLFRQLSKWSQMIPRQMVVFQNDPKRLFLTVRILTCDPYLGS